MLKIVTKKTRKFCFIWSGVEWSGVEGRSELTWMRRRMRAVGICCSSSKRILSSSLELKERRHPCMERNGDCIQEKPQDEDDEDEEGSYSYLLIFTSLPFSSSSSTSTAVSAVQCSQIMLLSSSSSHQYLVFNLTGVGVVELGDGRVLGREARMQSSKKRKEEGAKPYLFFYAKKQTKQSIASKSQTTGEGQGGII